MSAPFFPMVNYLKSKTILIDILFSALIVIVSLALISFYFPAQNLNVTYPDWMIQAFRIKTLELFGPISWTHMWSNGIDMWKSYQFVPHLITLGIVKLFNVDVPRAMVLMVIGQFVLLRVVVYVVARLLKFSPFTALFASLITLSIAYFWKAVGDYSLLFSFTFFPVILYLWVKYVEGKVQWLYPYIAGLMFYIHPILGMTSFGMWAISQFFIGVQIFSRRTFLQLFLFLLSSSLFWVPLVYKQSYTNSTVYLATKEFLQVSLSPFPYFGLSVTLLLFFCIALAQLFFPVQRKFKWVKILGIFVALYFGLIYIGTHISLPNFINKFQYTRGIGLIGLGIVFCTLPFIEYLQKNKSLFVKGLLVASLTVAVVEGMWITSYYSPDVLTATADPVTTFFQKNNINPEESRVWTPSIELSSYYGAQSQLRLPTSYMAHLESNHLPERLNQLITYRPFLSQIPTSELQRINDYFMVTGIKYVFLEEGSPFISVLKDKTSGYKHVDQIVVPGGLYEVFETPWDVKNSVLLSESSKDSLSEFPNTMKFNQTADQISLDNKVKDLNNVLNDPNNQTLPLSYPTQESLAITLPSNNTNQYVFINESFDKQWKAYVNGTEQEIAPVGPNFMLVKLQNPQSGGTLQLRHSWPTYYYYLIFAIPVIPFWLFIGRLLFSNSKSLRRNRRRAPVFAPRSEIINQGFPEMANLLKQ